jgi:hypothetical protein
MRTVQDCSGCLLLELHRSYEQAVWEITRLFSVKSSGIYSTSTYRYAARIETKEGPTFLGDFAKPPKVTINFVICVPVRIE